MASGWNTIDSDASVFTDLCSSLHIEGVQFEDLYSIDEWSLRALNSPVYGVVFLFKYTDLDKTSQPLDGIYDFDNKDIFFAQQTIQNACATQAVLNVLLNKTEDVEIGADMRGFKEFVDGFESDLKGETIGNSELIRQIHNSFSSPNPFFDDDRKSAQRSHDDDGLFHFVGYLRFQNKIYELDGLKQAPILHDADCPSDDAFMAKLPEILQRRISKYQATELRFSLLAIIKDKLEILKEFGADEHMIAQELEKRHQWHKENDLRKKDFVGLLCDVVKGIGAQASEAEWAQILANGRVRGTERSRIQRARKFDI